MNQKKKGKVMRLNSLVLASFIIILFSACSSNKIVFGGDTDDVYWSKSAAQNLPEQIEEAPQPSANQSNSSYEMPYSSQQNNNSGYDEQRANNAYQQWNAKRSLETQQQNQADNNNSNNQNNSITNNYNDNNYQLDQRSFGSNRSYYYNDPYYNSLSSNWGWTSFYNPIYRPGFYNWAPGFNIGLGMNSFNGWGMGMGYNTGWGMGFGFNNFGYSPWGFNGFYDPWFSPFGFYSPLWGPQWGWNSWGYGGFYSPWCGFGCGGWRGNNWRNNYFGNNGFGGNDVVTNRPMLRPRTQTGGGGSSLPPNGKVGNVRPDAPQQTMPNQDAQYNNRPGNAAPQYNTNKPGGDLINRGDGKPPVYVSPRSNPNNRENTDGNTPNVRQPNRSEYNTPDYSQPNNDRGNRVNETQPSYNNQQHAPEPRRENVQPRRESPQPRYEAPSPSPTPRSFGGGSSGGGRSSGGSSGGGSSPRSRPR